MTEAVLGLQLEKGHAAVDWSTRPLPEDWLRYAALDVEVLVELRMPGGRARRAGKAEWAQAGVRRRRRLAPALPPRKDPWRRTSGIHRVRKPRQLAAVRELWLARDELARGATSAPGRVLPDRAIIDAAVTAPTTREELVAMPVFGGRSTKRQCRPLVRCDRPRARPA